jgi:small subunit ribosomal protein S16
MDSRTKRDGKSLEILGYYHPLENKAEKRLVVNMDRVDHWIGQGACPTEAVGSLIRQARRKS